MLCCPDSRGVWSSACVPPLLICSLSTGRTLILVGGGLGGPGALRKGFPALVSEGPIKNCLSVTGFSISAIRGTKKLISSPREAGKETFNMEGKRTGDVMDEFLLVMIPFYLITKLQTRPVLPGSLQMWQRFRVNTPRVRTHLSVSAARMKEHRDGASARSSSLKGRPS